jgi:hypothetical protein
MPQVFDQRNRNIVVGVERVATQLIHRGDGWGARSLRDQLVERAGAGEAVHGRSLDERSRYQQVRRQHEVPTLTCAGSTCT